MGLTVFLASAVECTFQGPYSSFVQPGLTEFIEPDHIWVTHEHAIRHER